LAAISLSGILLWKIQLWSGHGARKSDRRRKIVMAVASFMYVINEKNKTCLGRELINTRAIQ
jgi:hypothetical protein